MSKSFENTNNTNMKGGVNMNIINNGNGTYTFNGAIYNSYIDAYNAMYDISGRVSAISDITIKSHILSNEYNPDMFAKVVAFQVKGENGETRTVVVDKVGLITLAGAALDSAILGGNKELLLEVVSHILKIDKTEIGRHKGFKYTRIMTEEIELDGKTVIRKTISKRGLKEICDKMKYCDLNMASNLMNVALDLNRVLRVYQETCIDAAKTGETIELNMLARNYRDLAVQAIDFDYEVREFDINDEKVELSIPVIKRVAPVNSKFKYIKSEFSMAQDAWAEEVTNSFAKVYNTDINMSADLLLDLQSALKAGVYPIDVIYNVKAMYMKLVSQYAQAKAIEEAGGHDSEGTMASDAFKIGCSILSQKVRKTLSKYTDTEKVIIVMAVALSNGIKDKRVNINKSNKFLLNMLKEEYEIFINNGNDMVDTGYVVTDNRGLNAGDICWFNSGICINTGSFISCRKTPYTGVATIEERNGKLCAMVPTFISVPSYDPNEEVVTFNTDDKLDIKVGDSIGVGKRRYFKNNTIVDVYINDDKAGQLFHSLINEKYLEGIRGTVTSFVCAYNGEESKYSRYTYTAKINKSITKEEVKELINQETANNYFEEEEIQIGEIFFSSDDYEYSLGSEVQAQETTEGDQQIVTNAINMNDEDEEDEDNLDDYLDGLLDEADDYSYDLSDR